MILQLIRLYYAVNPLVGLSATALRLYSALEVFRNADDNDSNDDDNNHEWFRAPQRDKRLQATGFSKTEMNKGLDELVKAGVLETQNKRRTLWYLLK